MSWMYIEYFVEGGGGGGGKSVNFHLRFRARFQEDKMTFCSIISTHMQDCSIISTHMQALCISLNNSPASVSIRTHSSLVIFTDSWRLARGQIMREHAPAALATDPVEEIPETDHNHQTHTWSYTVHMTHGCLIRVEMLNWLWRTAEMFSCSVY